MSSTEADELHFEDSDWTSRNDQVGHVVFQGRLETWTVVRGHRQKDHELATGMSSFEDLAREVEALSGVLHQGYLTIENESDPYGGFGFQSVTVCGWTPLTDYERTLWEDPKREQKAKEHEEQDRRERDRRELQALRQRSPELFR